MINLLVSSILAAFTGFLGGPVKTAAPYGIWERPSTGTQAKFYACGGNLCARIVGVQDRSRRHEIGTVILKGAAKTGHNMWEGDLTDIDSGKAYHGVATLQTSHTLYLKGCAAYVLCRGETWTRVK